MAYGKDGENRSRLTGNFSQRSSYSNRRPPRTGGSENRLYWADNYKPSESVDMLRLIPGEYQVEEVDAASGELVVSTLPWIQVVEHYHGGLKKGALCSGGPFRNQKGKRQLCHGCDMYWEDYQAREEVRQRTGTRPQSPRRISMSDKKVITTLDYGTYYKAEQLDGQGRVRTNNQGQPFYDWKKLMYANDPAAAGRETRMGRVLPWQLNHGQFETLRIYNQFNIMESCVGCGSYGTAMNKVLTTMHHVCRQCRSIVIDMQTTTLSPKQVEEITNAPFQCQQCGNRDFLEEVVYCAGCAAAGTVPKRANVWDVDIQVRMQQDPQNPSKQILTILNHSQPRPIDPRFLELAKPLDLLAIFKPTSPEKQRELWNISEQVPQQQMQGQPPQHAVPYGQQPPPQAQQPYPPASYAPPQAPPPGHYPPGYAPPPPMTAAPGGQPPQFAPPPPMGQPMQQQGYPPGTPGWAATAPAVGGFPPNGGGFPPHGQT